MIDPYIPQIQLFGSVLSSEPEQLLLNLPQADLPAGTLIFREGDHGDHFYIILQGFVDVVKALGTAKEKLMITRGPGESVGEMALLDPKHCRSASVRSRTDVKLVEINRRNFDAMLSLQPTITYDMARILGQRLRDADNATVEELEERKRQLAKAYQDLQTAQGLILEKQKIERELEVAWEIQQGLLPRSLPHLTGFNFGARMEPAQAVGGDFYDFIPLGHDKVGLVVGDVSGKGVPAALFMASTQSLMRTEARKGGSPKDTLQRLNTHLLEMNNVGMFVTLFYGVLDTTNCSLLYGRAGHELPVLCNCQREKVTPRYDPGEPLGVFVNPEIDEETIQLNQGDTLLLYTDGITDAFDERGIRFGRKRLHTSLADSCHLSAQQICNTLMEMVMTHQCMLPKHDDATLLAVQLCEKRKKNNSRR